MESGFKEITNSSYLYSGKLSVFEDKDMFKVIIPLLKNVEVIIEYKNK